MPKIHCNYSAFRIENIVRYWIWLNELVQGPFEPDELIMLHAFGEELLVCMEGREDWLPAGRVADLSTAMGQLHARRSQLLGPPPPQPPNRPPILTPLQGEFFGDPPGQQPLLQSEDEPKGPFAYRLETKDSDAPSSHLAGHATMPFHFSQPPRTSSSVLDLPRTQPRKVVRTAHPVITESPMPVAETAREEIETWHKPVVSLNVLEEETESALEDQALTSKYALPVSSPYDEPLESQRRPRWLLWIIGVILAILALGSAGYWLMDRPSTHSAIAEANRIASVDVTPTKVGAQSIAGGLVPGFRRDDGAKTSAASSRQGSSTSQSFLQKVISALSGEASASAVPSGTDTLAANSSVAGQGSSGAQTARPDPSVDVTPTGVEAQSVNSGLVPGIRRDDGTKATNSSSPSFLQKVMSALTGGARATATAGQSGAGIPAVSSSMMPPQTQSPLGMQNAAASAPAGGIGHMSGESSATGAQGSTGAQGDRSVGASPSPSSNFASHQMAQSSPSLLQRVISSLTGGSVASAGQSVAGAPSVNSSVAGQGSSGAQPSSPNSSVDGAKTPIASSPQGSSSSQTFLQKVMSGLASAASAAAVKVGIGAAAANPHVVLAGAGAAAAPGVAAASASLAHGVASHAATMILPHGVTSGSAAPKRRSHRGQAAKPHSKKAGASGSSMKSPGAAVVGGAAIAAGNASTGMSAPDRTATAASGTSPGALDASPSSSANSTSGKSKKGKKIKAGSAATATGSATSASATALNSGTPLRTAQAASIPGLTAAGSAVPATSASGAPFDSGLPMPNAKTAVLPGLAAVAAQPAASASASDIPVVDVPVPAKPRKLDPWAGRLSEAIKLVMSKNLPHSKITVGEQARAMLQEMHEKELMHAADTGERLYLPDKLAWAALQEEGPRYRVYVNFLASQANGERVQARSYQFMVDLQQKTVHPDDPATQQDLLSQPAELTFKHNPMATDIDSILGGVDTYHKHEVQLIIIKKSRSNREDRKKIEAALLTSQNKIKRAVLYFRRTYTEKALQNVAKAYIFTELLKG